MSKDKPFYDLDELVALYREDTPKARAEIEWQTEEWTRRMMEAINKYLNA